jgi:hypothetical protein
VYNFNASLSNCEYVLFDFVVDFQFTLNHRNKFNSDEKKSTIHSYFSCIFIDEASECGDHQDVSRSTATSANRKHHDWSAQVDSEQQQETGYSTDSMIPSDTLPRGNSSRRGGQRGSKRGRPPLPNRQGVLAILIA